MPLLPGLLLPKGVKNSKGPIYESKRTVQSFTKDNYKKFYGGARGVMVIVAGYGHGDTSSNPGLIAFHIALIPLADWFLQPGKATSLGEGKLWIQSC